jgi:hypothetical protein
MRPRTLFTAAALCLYFTLSATAEPVKDPASLLPADTLAYAELRQPGASVKEIAGLFENTPFANVPDSLIKLWGPKGAPTRGGAGRIGAVGLFLSPEMIKEAERVQGAAVAMTGIKDGQPEGVLMILPGESNGPGFLMRAFLTVEGVKQIGEVEGVKLYQHVGFSATQPAEPPREERRQREEREERQAVRHSHDPVFAMMPDLLLIGSADAVKDVIRQAKGKVKAAALASADNFKAINNSIGSGPGAFAYLNLPDLLAAIEKGCPFLGQHEQKVLAAMKDVLGLKAFRAAGYAVGLEKGTLRYRELVLLDPKEKSAIVNLLPSQPVKKELLHFTPANTVMAGVMSNAKGAERWAEFLKLADAISKVGGENKLPSEEIAGLEKALGLDIGKDVCGKISDIAFALGDPLKAPIKRTEKKGEGFREVSMYPELPCVMILQANDEDAATALMEKVFPKVFAAIAHKEDLKAESKKVEGQTIYTLPVQEQMGVQYGRSGKTIVIGAFPMPVAQALNNGVKEKGWLSQENVASRAREVDGAVFVVAMKPMTLMLSVSMPLAQRRATEGRVAPAPREKPQTAPPRALREAADEEPVKLPKELMQLLEKEELLVVRVTRKDDRILEEITWPGLKTVVSAAVEGMMKWAAIAEPIAPKEAPAPERRNEDR